MRIFKRKATTLDSPDSYREGSRLTAVFIKQKTLFLTKRGFCFVAMGILTAKHAKVLGNTVGSRRKSEEQ